MGQSTSSRKVRSATFRKTCLYAAGAAIVGVTAIVAVPLAVAGNAPAPSEPLPSTSANKYVPPVQPHMNSVVSERKVLAAVTAELSTYGDLTAMRSTSNINSTTTAEGVLDDGHGRAFVSMLIAPGFGAGSAEEAPCEDDPADKRYTCSRTELADGSVVMASESPEYSDGREPQLQWEVVHYRTDGSTISITEWNAPAQKGVPVTRKTGPLGFGAMKKIIQSPTITSLIQ